MNMKISRILGVGLSLILLASLMVMAIPASAGTLSLSAETDYPKTDNVFLAPGNKILDIAVNADVIYAATANSTTQSLNAGALYKSTNAGKTWTSLESSTDWPGPGTGPAGRNVVKVAVAPDDANVVLVATDNNTIYYSDDGGSTWNNMGIPTNCTGINDIDVSAGSPKVLAAAGTTASGAELFVLKLDIATTWVKASQYTGFSKSQTKALAVKCSPNYDIDKVITVVTANTTSVRFQVYRNEKSGEFWNGNIYYFDAIEWGTGSNNNTGQNITYETAGQDASIPGASVASIALMPDYLGSEAQTRTAFIGITATSGSGAYRLSDTYLTEFATWNNADEGKINSVAYHKDDILLAGMYDKCKVYSCEDPMATNPKFSRVNELKQPGGVDTNAKVVVEWSGNTAVSGSQGVENAFSVSTDSGYSWNDISMISTEALVPSSKADDIAVSADGSVYYLSSHNGQYTSIWRKDGTGWQRIFSYTADNSNQAAFLLRVAPANADVLYMSSKTTKNMWVSKDGGLKDFKSVPAYKLSNEVRDFEVVNADTVYAIDATQCAKTISAGQAWLEQVGLDGLPEARTIYVAPNEDIFIGAAATGDIAFSKDKGLTFTRITTAVGQSLGSLGAIPSGSTTHVVVDKNYATNGIIYGAVGNIVKRSKAAVAKDVGWDAVTPEDSAGVASIASSQYITGMVQYGGAIYVLSSGSSSARSPIIRSLDLSNVDKYEWSKISPSSSGGQRFYNNSIVPRALKMSESKSVPKFWMVNRSTSVQTGSGPLDSVTDPIWSSGATLKSPDDAFRVLVNPEGQAYNVTFVWERYKNKYIDDMQLQIATDSKFTAIVYDQVFTGIDADSIARVVGPTGPITTVETTSTESVEGYTYTSTDNQGGITTIVIPGYDIEVPSTYVISQICELNPGGTYYWRVRAAETGPWYSPWTAARTFTVASTKEFVIISPEIGAAGVAIQPSLTWSEYSGAIGYEIQLAEDKTFAILEFAHTTTEPFYQTEADEALKYSTTYYWKVRGVTGPAPISKKGELLDAPGGPWITGVFTTAGEPVEPTPPVVIQQPTAPEVKVVQVPVPQPAPIPAYLLWIIIVIGAILIIALIVLIVRTRRVT